MICSKVYGSAAAVNQTVPAAPQRRNGGKPDLTETAADQKARGRENLPSPELLLQLLDYDPETGVLCSRRTGKPVGFQNRCGYLMVWIGDRRHRAHRVAWAMLHGEWPSGQIDHINGVRGDNRALNLRDVTHAENGRNTKRPSTNISGALGVCWNSQRGKWQAYINCDGRRKHLGLFPDFDAAVAARKAAEVEFGYSPNHGRHA